MGQGCWHPAGTRPHPRGTVLEVNPMNRYASSSLRVISPAFPRLLVAHVALGLVVSTLGLAASACAQQEGPTPAPTAAPQIEPASPAAAPATSPAPAPSPAPVAAPAVAPAAAPAAAPTKLELPVGTHLPLVLHNGVSTRTAKVGDPVYFETLFPVMLNGKVIVPAGSYVSGEITETKRPGRVKGKAEIMLRLETLILPNAYMVSFAGSPSGTSTGGNETTDAEGKIIGASDKGSDIGTIAKTTAAGAGIGGIAGAASGRPGAGLGIGAAAGLATGLAAVLLTRGPEAELPRGTTLDAVLDRPLTFDADKITFTGPGQASTLSGPGNREEQRVKLNPF